RSRTRTQPFHPAGSAPGCRCRPGAGHRPAHRRTPWRATDTQRAPGRAIRSVRDHLDTGCRDCISLTLRIQSPRSGFRRLWVPYAIVLNPEWQACWLAVGLLTRIPMLVQIDYSLRLMGLSSIYFPLVGLLLGAQYVAAFFREG